MLGETARSSTHQEHFRVLRQYSLDACFELEQCSGNDWWRFTSPRAHEHAQERELRNGLSVCFSGFVVVNDGMRKHRALLLLVWHTFMLPLTYRGAYTLTWPHTVPTRNNQYILNVQYLLLPICEPNQYEVWTKHINGSYNPDVPWLTHGSPFQRASRPRGLIQNPWWSHWNT